MTLDKHLDWTNHINYMITKIIYRSSLLKRAKKYLPLLLRELSYNALIKSILEYYCSVWGNTTNDNLIRLLRIQKRGARLILDTNFYASSVNLFNKPGLIPFDDIIELSKLCIQFNNGKCSDITSIIISATSIPDIIMKLERQLIWNYLSTIYLSVYWSTYISCKWPQTLE